MEHLESGMEHVDLILFDHQDVERGYAQALEHLSLGKRFILGMIRLTSRAFFLDFRFRGNDPRLLFARAGGAGGSAGSCHSRPRLKPSGQASGK